LFSGSVFVRGTQAGISSAGVSIFGGTLDATGNDYGISATEGFSFCGGTLIARGERAVDLGMYVVINCLTYTFWANDQPFDPGGSGSTYPPMRFDFSDRYQFVKIAAPSPPLTATLRTPNPTTPATIQLKQANQTIYTTTTTPPDPDAADQSTQPFTFPAVAPGTYTLVVTKPAHTQYIIQSLTVGAEPIDLSAQPMTLRCGDINGDDMINDRDLTMLWKVTNYNQSVENAEDPECDLNGDGAINDRDLTILWAVGNYNQGAVEVTQL